MFVSASHSNLPAMEHKLQVLMSVYPWVNMVVFSELAPFGPLTANAVEYPNSTEEQFCAWAKRYGVWLIPGTVFRKEGDKIFNTALVINPQGETIGRYDKMFPFLPYEEGVSGGDQFLLFDVPDVGKFAVSICYDMWFPETSRTLASMGAEVILHPSLTGSIDRDIELAIAQSTAAINQCFFFDINGLGDGGIGKSIVCGPDGRVLHQAGQGPEMIPIEIDLDRVSRSRERGILTLGQPLKSFRDRTVEFEIYQEKHKIPYLESLGRLIKPTKNHQNHMSSLKVKPEINPADEEKNTKLDVNSSSNNNVAE